MRKGVVCFFTSFDFSHILYLKVKLSSTNGLYPVSSSNKIRFMSESRSLYFILVALLSPIMQREMIEINTIETMTKVWSKVKYIVEKTVIIVKGIILI